MLSVVYVVDDDASFRVAIRRRLEKAGFQVETYPSAQHFLDQRPDEGQPGCILLDARLPGLSGSELQTRLAELGSALPIVFLTGYPEIKGTVLAIKAGAENVLTKPVKSDDLLAAIEQAVARHAQLRASAIEQEAFRSRLASLTPRERQVFDLVVRGKINRQIASELKIVERTAKAHRGRVIEKMRVQSLAELVFIATRLRLLGD